MNQLFLFVITFSTFFVTLIFGFFWNCRNFYTFTISQGKQQLPGKKVSNVMFSYDNLNFHDCTSSFHSILVKFYFFVLLIVLY